MRQACTKQTEEQPPAPGAAQPAPSAEERPGPGALPQPGDLSLPIIRRLPARGYKTAARRRSLGPGRAEPEPEPGRGERRGARPGLPSCLAARPGSCSPPGSGRRGAGRRGPRSGTFMETCSARARASTRADCRGGAGGACR